MKKSVLLFCVLLIVTVSTTFSQESNLIENSNFEGYTTEGNNTLPSATTHLILHGKPMMNTYPTRWTGAGNGWGETISGRWNGFSILENFNNSSKTMWGITPESSQAYSYRELFQSIDFCNGSDVTFEMDFALDQIIDANNHIRHIYLFLGNLPFLEFTILRKDNQHQFVINHVGAGTTSYGNSYSYNNIELLVDGNSYETPTYPTNDQVFNSYLNTNLDSQKNTVKLTSSFSGGDANTFFTANEVHHLKVNIKNLDLKDGNKQFKIKIKEGAVFYFGNPKLYFTKPEISEENKNVVICNGSNVNLNTLVEGNTPNNAVLKWYSNASLITELIDPTSVGTGSYWATYVNSTCKSEGVRVDVLVSPEISLSASAEPVTCFDGDNGKARLNITGGVPPYNMTGDINANNISSNTYEVSNLSVGNYNITITDANGCFKETSFTINDFVYLPKPTLSVTDNDCDNATLGEFMLISAVPTGIKAQYSTNNGTSWTDELPTYSEVNSITLIARLVSATDNTCIKSENSDPVTSYPNDCSMGNISCGGSRPEPLFDEVISSTKTVNDLRITQTVSQDLFSSSAAIAGACDAAHSYSEGYAYLRSGYGAIGVQYVEYTFSQPIKEVEVFFMVMGNNNGQKDYAKVKTYKNSLEVNSQMEKNWECSQDRTIKVLANTISTNYANVYIANYTPYSSSTNDVSVKVSNPNGFTKLRIEDPNIWAYTGLQENNGYGYFVTICPTSVKKQPKLTVSKIASTTGPVKAEDEITYTVMVTNNYRTTLTGIDVKDLLPEGVDLVANSTTRTYNINSTVATTGSTTKTYNTPRSFQTFASETFNFSTADNIPANATITSINYKATGKANSYYDYYNGYYYGNCSDVSMTLKLPYGQEIEEPKGVFGNSYYGNWLSLNKSKSITATQSALGNYTFRFIDNNPLYDYYDQTLNSVELTVNWLSFGREETTDNVQHGVNSNQFNLVNASDNISLEKGESIILTYKVKVKTDIAETISTLTNTVTANSNETDEKLASAEVSVCQLKAIATEKEAVQCFGENNGKVEIEITNGHQPYSITMQGITYSNIYDNSYEQPGLEAGNYNLVVRDAKGCVSQETTVTVTEPQVISLNPPTITHLTTYGANDGSVTIIAEGGNDGIKTFTLYKGVVQKQQNATGLFESLEPGVYTVFVEDEKGCSATKENIEISFIDAVNDINQTPEQTAVNGNVLTNDKNVRQVASAKFYTGDNTTADLTLGLEITIKGKNKAGNWVDAGTLKLNPDGTYTFTPVADFIGTISVDYTATNDKGITDVANLSIEVVSTPTVEQNNPPIAQNDTYTAEQGEEVSVPVLANDSDPDGDNLIVTEVKANASNGSDIILNNVSQNVYVNGELAGQAKKENDQIVFEPAQGFVGNVPFIYTISDGNGGTDNAIATVTVIKNNTDPNDNQVIANDDANTGKQGDILSGNILDNDIIEGVLQDLIVDISGVNTQILEDGTLLTIPNKGKLLIYPDGSYIYTPHKDFVGTIHLPYRICNTDDKCDKATLYLTVLGEPIDAVNDINQTPVKTPVNGNVLDNDLGNDIQVSKINGQDVPEGGFTTIQIDGKGELKIYDDGSYIFTPDNNFDGGSVDFTYTITNGKGATDKANLSIEVVPNKEDGKNNPPIAQNDTYTAEQGEEVSLPVLANDSDPDGDNLTVTEIIAEDGHVILTEIFQNIEKDGKLIGKAKKENNQIVFEPVQGFVGTVPFTYTVSDGNGGMDNAIATVTVIRQNNVYATDDNASGKKGENVTGNILTNDVVEGGVGTLTVGGTPINSDNTSISIPGKGTIKLNKDGSFTFIPEPNFTGSVELPYTVCNQEGQCDSSNLTITIYPNDNNTDINVPPVAVKDKQTIKQEQTANIILTANDYDVDRDVLNVTKIVAKGSGNTMILLSETEQDVYALDGTTKIGKAQKDGNKLIFTPELGFTGDVPFFYTISDNHEHKASTTATVTVIDVTKVVANDDANTGVKNQTLSDNILYNDQIEGTLGVITMDINGGTEVSEESSTITLTNGGKLLIYPDGSYIYTPKHDFVGTEIVPYEVCNTYNKCNSATLYLTTLEEPIKAVNDINQTPEQIAVSGNVLINDKNATQVASAKFYTGDNTTADLILGSETVIKGKNKTGNWVDAGTLKLNPDGTYTFIPVADFIGTISVDYTATNDEGITDVANLSIEVVSTPTVEQNNPPIAQNDTYTAEQGEEVSVPVLANDSDPDGDNLIVTEVKANASNGSDIILNNVFQNVYVNGELVGQAKKENDQIVFEPAQGFVGNVPFTYTISDGNGGIDTAIATVTVIRQNNVYATDDNASGKEGENITGNILTNDVVEGGVGTLNVSGTPIDSDNTSISISGKGTINVNEDGSYTFTPISGFTGKVKIPYEVCNKEGQCDGATLIITVYPKDDDSTKNDSPVAVNDKETVEQGQSAEVSVLDNDYDVDGDNLSITKVIANGIGNTKVEVTGAETNIYDTNGLKVGTAKLVNNKVVFTPESDFIGDVPFLYTISDGHGHTDSAIALVSVVGVNKVVANDDAKIGNKGQIIELTEENKGILANDIIEGTLGMLKVNINGTTTEIADAGNIFEISNKGKLTINKNGTYKFVPNKDFVGTVEIPYEVSNTNGMNDKATLYLTILDEPIDAKDDVTQTPINISVSGNVITNDKGSVIKVTKLNGENDLTANITGGTLVIDEDGNFTFTPTSNWSGKTSVNYTITDKYGKTSEATLYITVIKAFDPGDNNPPVANDDIYRTKQGKTLSFNVMKNDFDPDENSELSVTKIKLDTNGNGSHEEIIVPTTGSITKDVYQGTRKVGTITIQSNGNGIFESESDFTGDVPHIEYTIDDAHGGTDTADIIIVTVPEGNSLTNMLFANDDEGYARNASDDIDLKILKNDFDPEGDDFKIVSIKIPSKVDGTMEEYIHDNLKATGTLEDVSLYNKDGINIGKLTVDKNGFLHFDGAPGFKGTISFPYTIEDVKGAVSNATIILTQGDEGNTPLPIELYSYDAQLQDNRTVRLDWISETEINNDYYSLYKSEDGINWDLLTEVEGAGNSSIQQHYNFVDVNPYEGITYYKLLQTDFDGTTKELGIRSVKFVVDLEPISLEIYPNPARNFVTFEGHFQDVNTLQILDVRGVNLSSRVNFLSESEYKIKLDISRLPKGVYVLRIDNFVGKFIKQ